MRNVKPKGRGREPIRGSNLHITEADVLSALPFGKRISAFFFGGVFYMPDPTPRPMADTPELVKPRAAVTYLPPLPKRVYFKYIHRHFRGIARMLRTLYGNRTFNPYKIRNTLNEK